MQHTIGGIRHWWKGKQTICTRNILTLTLFFIGSQYNQGSFGLRSIWIIFIRLSIFSFRIWHLLFLISIVFLSIHRYSSCLLMFIKAVHGITLSRSPARRFLTKYLAETSLPSHTTISSRSSPSVNRWKLSSSNSKLLERREGYTRSYYNSPWQIFHNKALTCDPLGKNQSKSLFSCSY